MFNEYNQNKLKNLYNYLIDNNLHYKELFTRYDITNAESIITKFKNLPVVDKKEYRNYYLQALSEVKENCYEEFTSGSTGIPIKCLKTESERMVAYKELTLQRKAIDFKYSEKQFLSLYGYTTRRNVGNVFDLDEVNMIKCFENIRKILPRWLCGPITVIEKYAELVACGKLEYIPSLKFIEFNGEFIDKARREFIEDAMNCKTVNHYGLRECWCVAYECIHKQLHVMNRQIYVESLNITGLNEIVITSFYNKYMPVIRYNTNDIGNVIRSECECGNKADIIKLVGGRTSDLIIGENRLVGTIAFKRAFNGLIHSGHNSIKAFTVIQKGIDHFLIYLVKSDDYCEQAKKILLGNIYHELKKKVKVEITYVDDIPLVNGKRKVFHALETD